MLLKNNIKELTSIVKPDSVLTALEERYCYATDASNVENNVTLPDLVIFVETIDEVQQILRFANAHSIPVISRGAGTNMVGACICNKGGIVLNFSKMNKIINISPTNLTATVQPGVLLGELKDKVEALGLFYPPDPSNFKVSTVGGSIAQSSGGAMAFKYGTTKDYVLSLKVVTADGKVMTLGANTVKDAVGYHLAQLMVGSEGTLGVVVEATLKLIPKPEAEQLVVAYFSSVSQAINAIDSLIYEKIFPSAIEFMDKNSIVTVENFLHCGLDVDKECLILINIDGNESMVNEHVLIAEKVLNNLNASKVLRPDKNLSDSIWRARRSSFAATTRLASDVISDDIIVPRTNLSKMIQYCNEIADKYDLKMCLVGHIGDGNIHPQIALNLEDETEFRNYKMAKAEIYSHVKDLGGSISAEHGVGLEKKSYISSVVDNNSLNYMKMIKKVFDPNNILNPGKIFDV